MENSSRISRPIRRTLLFNDRTVIVGSVLVLLGAFPLSAGVVFDSLWLRWTGIAAIGSALGGFALWFLSAWWFSRRAAARTDKIRMRDGDAILIMVKDGKVIHHSSNMSLPHVEFVKRATGDLPEGAWVGTVSKLGADIAAISSKYFFGYQLPAPPEVAEAVKRTFE